MDASNSFKRIRIAEDMTLVLSSQWSRRRDERKICTNLTNMSLSACKVTLS
jgi:hypothetical protein